MRTHELAALGARLGKDTHGVVSANELRAAKADMTVLPRLISGGDWSRLWRGMYLTAAHPPGQVVLSQAAIKHAALRHRDACGAARPVVTGLAGARALGLRWVPDGQRVQVHPLSEAHAPAAPGPGRRAPRRRNAAARLGGARRAAAP